MFDFHEKRKIRSWLFSKFAIALLLIASAFLALSVYERYEKERETAAKYEERSLELSSLAERAAALEAKVEYMESGRGIEEEIRDRYDVVKEGERAIVVMDAPPEASTTAPPPTVTDERGFLSWIFFWR